MMSSYTLVAALVCAVAPFAAGFGGVTQKTCGSGIDFVNTTLSRNGDLDRVIGTDGFLPYTTNCMDGKKNYDFIPTTGVKTLVHLKTMWEAPAMGKPVLLSGPYKANGDVMFDEYYAGEARENLGSEFDSLANQPDGTSYIHQFGQIFVTVQNEVASFGGAWTYVAEQAAGGALNLIDAFPIVLSNSPPPMAPCAASTYNNIHIGSEEWGDSALDLRYIDVMTGENNLPDGINDGGRDGYGMVWPYMLSKYYDMPETVDNMFTLVQPYFQPFPWMKMQTSADATGAFGMGSYTAMKLYQFPRIKYEMMRMSPDGKFVLLSPDEGFGFFTMCVLSIPGDLTSACTLYVAKVHQTAGFDGEPMNFQADLEWQKVTEYEVDLEEAQAVIRGDLNTQEPPVAPGSYITFDDLMECETVPAEESCSAGFKRTIGPNRNFYTDECCMLKDTETARKFAPILEYRRYVVMNELGSAIWMKMEGFGISEKYGKTFMATSDWCSSSGFCEGDTGVPGAYGAVVSTRAKGGCIIEFDNVDMDGMMVPGSMKMQICSPDANQVGWPADIDNVQVFDDLDTLVFGTDGDGNGDKLWTYNMLTGEYFTVMEVPDGAEATGGGMTKMGDFLYMNANAQHPQWGNYLLTEAANHDQTENKGGATVNYVVGKYPKDTAGDIYSS